MITQKNRLQSVCFVADAGAKHMLHWAAVLARHDLRIDYISFHPVSIPGVRAITLQPLCANSYVKYLVNAARLAKTLAGLNPDWVHSYYTTNYALLASLSRPARLAVTVAGSDLFDDPPVHPIFNLSNRWVFHRSRLLHSMAQHMTRRLCTLGDWQSKIITLPEGVDQNVFPPYTDRPSQRLPVVISARHLDPLYDVGTLIAAIPLVLKSYPAAKFLIIGDGTEKEKLQNLVLANKAGHAVRFAGRLSWSDLSREFRQAKVYVTTSPADGMSVTLLQAMISGMMPVVTDIPANREWVCAEQNGFLFPPGQAPALAQQIVQALAQIPFQEQAAATNRQTVLENGLDKVAIDRLLEAYQKYY